MTMDDLCRPGGVPCGPAAGRTCLVRADRRYDDRI